MEGISDINIVKQKNNLSWQNDAFTSTSKIELISIREINVHSIDELLVKTNLSILQEIASDILEVRLEENISKRRVLRK